MVNEKSAKERFFHSCIVGDLNSIKTDLFYSVSPFSQDKYGNNALHLTCMNNQPKVLEYLLKTVKTFKNDTQNKLGRTALSIAASQGAFECINILLDNLLCNVNSTDENFKNTPLHWCVTSNCVEGVEKLLNRGADFMMVNKFGKTPLQLARTSSLEIFNLIDKFAKNKNKNLNVSSEVLKTNDSIETKTKMHINSDSSTKFKVTDESSKVFKKMDHKDNDIGGTTLEPDLTSNNSNGSFFLDISKLKHGDSSVLKLLEKSIEPVDETSFVSSILNSGKVIQLTEAGILALEYTKNEITTPIPDQLVKSLLTTSMNNENEYKPDGNTPEKDNESDSKIPIKGLKRFKKSQLPSSKRFKSNEIPIDKKSEHEILLEEQLLNSRCAKSKIQNSNSSTSETNKTTNNNEICSKNQLVCLNSDINTQPKWVEDLMCLFNKLENSIVIEHKSI